VVSQVASGPLGQTLVLDHGNGWQTTIEGVQGALVEAGASVARAQPLGVVGAVDTVGRGLLRFGVILDGRSLDPQRYLLRS
jgi:murein DD-endopeptidase MepM/ murein hydrolase activator NlpD